MIHVLPVNLLLPHSSIRCLKTFIPEIMLPLDIWGLVVSFFQFHFQSKNVIGDPFLSAGGDLMSQIRVDLCLHKNEQKKLPV